MADPGRLLEADWDKGYDVIEAETADEAAQLLDRELVDILMTDAFRSGSEKRAELARTAGRFDGSWSDDRTGTSHRRRRAWLLGGARGGVADDPALALHRAQDRPVLGKLPKSVRPAAKAALRQILAAPDCATAETAFATFAEKYGAKYEKAVTCLTKDGDKLLTSYDLPVEHWDHLRTSDEMDKRFRRKPVIFIPRGRRRGEERGVGWKLCRAA